MAEYEASGLGIAHISGNKYRDYESARSGFFMLSFDFDPDERMLKPNRSSVEPGAAQESDWLDLTAANDLMLNVLKAPVPHFSVGVEEMRRGNDMVKYATIPTWDNGQITVDDVVGIETKDILLAWLYQAYNPYTRKGGRMYQYKKSAHLTEYTQDYTKVRTWNIEGIFVTKISEEDFDKENDGKRKLTVEFSYDRATLATDVEAKS